MTLFQAFILGIVQGLTEFLPISSSGHLVLVPFLFGWQLNPEQVFPFDTLVQMGTLVAVIIYFWKDLVSIVVAVFKGLADRKPFGTQDARIGWLLVLATIPAGIAGLLLENVIEAAFHSATATAIFLLLTAGLLLLAEWLGKRTRQMERDDLERCPVDRRGANAGLVPGGVALRLNHGRRHDPRPQTQ